MMSASSSVPGRGETVPARLSRLGYALRYRDWETDVIARRADDTEIGLITPVAALCFLADRERGLPEAAAVRRWTLPSERA